MRLRFLTVLPLCIAAWAVLHVAPVHAEPAALEDAPDPPADSLPFEPPARPAAEEMPEAVMRDASQALVEEQLDQDRQAVIQSTYDSRPPTWIQHASQVNLGDFPTLNDPTEDAERRIKTLQWLLEDRQRQAAEAAASAARGDGPPLPPAVAWIKVLLPTTWLPFVKEHREAVLTAGGGLLLMGWLYSTLVRRGQGERRSVPVEAQPETATDKPRRRRRRRRRVRSTFLAPLTRSRS